MYSQSCTSSPPVAVEAPGVRPETVDEVEAGLLERLERRVRAGERVERGGGGEQVGDGRRRRRTEPAPRQVTSTEPRDGPRIGGTGKPPLDGQRGRGRGRQAVRRARPIGVAAVRRAQRGQGIGKPIGLGERDAQVLVGPEGQEGTVRGPVFRPAGRAVAAVRRAIGLEPFDERARRRLARGTDVGPAAGEARGVHEVELGRVVVALQVAPHPCGRQGAPQCRQRLESEDGVVEVARPAAILEAAVRIQPCRKELRRQVRRVTEQRRRQPGHLQHFEPQTHCTSPGSRR